MAQPEAWAASRFNSRNGREHTSSGQHPPGIKRFCGNWEWTNQSITRRHDLRMWCMTWTLCSIPSAATRRSELEMGQRPYGFVERNSTMIEDFLKLCWCFFALVCGQ